MAVAASDFATILKRVRSNLLESGVRYKKTTSTGTGSADGTTIISTNLTQNDDAWNNMDCIILSGALDGHKRVVEDFTESSNTLHFTNNPFIDEVAASVDFELIERGIWAGDDLKIFIEQAANWFLRRATDLNVNYTVQETIGSVLGVCDLPANVLKFVHPIVTIDGNVAAIISPNRASQFDDDPFIDSANGDPIAYFIGRANSTKNIGRLKHKPATNASCIYNFVPVASFDDNGTWKVPEECWDAIQALATGLALRANERNDLAQTWIQQGLSYLPPEKNIEKPIPETA